MNLRGETITSSIILLLVSLARTPFIIATTTIDYSLATYWTREHRHQCQAQGLGLFLMICVISAGLTSYLPAALMIPSRPSFVRKVTLKPAASSLSMESVLPSMCIMSSKLEPPPDLCEPTSSGIRPQYVPARRDRHWPKGTVC